MQMKRGTKTSDGANKLKRAPRCVAWAPALPRLKRQGKLTEFGESNITGEEDQDMVQVLRYILMVNIYGVNVDIE